MEGQKCTEKKTSDSESSKMTNAEQETFEAKTEENGNSEAKNCETFEMGFVEKASSKTTDNSINSSSVVKDRGKIEYDKKSEAFRKIPHTQNKRDFKDTAKYRDGESYAQQHHHSIGTGLFITDEIRDLPPRFREKVVKALENALALHNIQVGINPLENFVSYSDDSKKLDKNEDKLVYIPPNVLEDERKSCENKNDSALPSKANSNTKKSSELHQNSTYDPSLNRMERGKPPFAGANLNTQIASQNFRQKSDAKPYFSRTHRDNDYSARQKSSRGNSVSKHNVQNQKFNPNWTNAYAEPFPLPSKSFKRCLKCPSRDKSILKSISDALKSNVDAKTLFGMLSQLSCQNCNGDFNELLDEIRVFQEDYNPELQSSYDKFPCNYQYEDVSNKNETNFERKRPQFHNYKKSNPNSNGSNLKTFTRISVNEIFPNYKSGSKTALESESTERDSCLASPSVSEQIGSNSKLNKTSDDFRANAKTYSKNKTYTNSNTQFECADRKNTSFNRNKKPFKSQGKYFAINSTSNENKHHVDFSRSTKSFVNHTDSSDRNHIHTAESSKYEGKQFHSDSVSNTNNTLNYSKSYSKSSDAFPTVSNVPNYSEKDNSCSMSKGIPSKKFVSDNRYLRAENEKKFANNKKFNNLGKVSNLPPDKEESDAQYLRAKNISVQNKHRKRNDSHSSISSSHSSKLYDSIPQHYDSPSNVQANFKNSVSSNHNSFESFSHEKHMYKQLDRRSDFNRSKNYRSYKDKYSDSSSVLSDHSARTRNSSDNISSVSDNYNFNQNEKNTMNKTYSHRNGKYFDKYSDSSSVLSDNSARTRNSFDNISSVSDNYNFNQTEKNTMNKTYSQRNGKYFPKPSDKHFDEYKEKKFIQNSKQSPRDQAISEKKYSSRSSAENLHQSNQTDFTSRKSSSNEEYKSGSRDYEKKQGQNSNKCVSFGFFVKVEVSDKVRDLKNWMEYFQSIFSFPFDFERCCYFSDVLILNFERKEEALTALDILYRQKKILQHSKKPFFLQISTLLNKLIKPCNCKEKAINDCVANIRKHYQAALCVVNSIKQEILNPLPSFKKYKSKREVDIAETTILKSFEASESNFAAFKENTVSEVKNADFLWQVQQARHSFIRECNLFKRCLPIYSKKVEIVDLAKYHNVSVIVAETGSGKSTQIVEYLLHSSVSENGRIICTQPRKLAAISIAQFVSGQIGSAIGKMVGYDVGIDKKCTDDTKITYMTDYCLLKYFLNHRQLKGISCIIIDEAHERSLYTDLILGLLKKCLDVRKDLSILITSATINPTIFVNYFKMPEKCVIEVPGRTYPVNVHWYQEDVEIGWDYLDACVRQAYEIHSRKEEGDILVFLTSHSESEEAIYLFKRLLSNKDKKPQLLSLHGKSDIQDQMLIFQKTSNSRKIIFATNVAETAVTIPGIKYVIDSGMAKELMFDPKKNKSYLAVTFITKSAAEQRKGRAGRTQSGDCYRMYSKRNYAENMSDNAVPEILKSNLQKALLKIFEFGIDPEKFDFIEAPPARTISNSVESLENLGAIKNKRLTDLGKKLVKLPLEPQLSKLILQGIEARIGFEVIIIAALVSESGKLFIRNEDNKALADEKKKKFCHAGGDLCTFLEIYKRWRVIHLSERYEWCVNNFVSCKALFAAAKIVKEILITLRTDLGIHVKSEFNNNEFKKQYEKIIFDSFSENLCVLSGHPKLGYLSPYFSESFFIHPSSTLSYLGKDSPEFLVYSTLMETSRNFLFDITPISEATLKTAYQTGKFNLPLHTLRSLQVPPKIMGPFGESVLIRHILGKGGIKIRDLEKALMQITSVKNLYVDVDVTKGLITVYLSQRLHEKVENHIQQIINEALIEMLKEEDVIKLSGTSLYFAMSAGGIVNDVIMPGEFRELVFNHVQPKDSKELENVLQMFEPLQYLSHVSSKQEMQICATFKKVCDAKKAFLDLKKIKKYDVSPKPYLPNVSDKTLPLYMLSISWCCRPSNGFGVVELFSEEDLIEASGTLTCNSFFVGNNLIMFQVAREDRTLSMRNLPEHIEESTIREKLKESLPHIKIKSIQIIRKKVIITEATVEEAKRKLSKLLSCYVSSSKFIIDLKLPIKEASWNAIVYFDKDTDAENTFMKLKDNTCIDLYPLSVRQIFKSQLYCGRDVFDKFSVQVNSILKEKKAEGICNEISIKRLEGKFGIQVEFTCLSLGELNKTRESLRTFLGGEHLELIGNSKYHFLFTEGLTKQVKKIQESTNTFIKLQNIKKVVSLYGSPNACQKAKREIHCLVLNQDYSVTRTFNLKNSCIPYGFLKHLYSEYGYDLRGLVSSFKLTVASVDNYGSTLTLKGSKEQIKKAEQALEKMCETLFNSKGKRQKKNGDEEDCPICLDPVSYDFQRLENCGHAFCRQCLLLQIESKAVPVVCVKQDCGKLIFLEDIKRIVSIGGDELKKTFCDIALQYHVSCNVGKLSYCHTPDCQMVYRVTKEGSEYKCPSCKNSACTRCQATYHYGMSCEMYQECQKDEDYSLKMWVKENESARKSCPSCKVIIEKAEGCNHMECLNCKSHLCWLCLEIFPTGDDVYNHLPYCPKNQ